MPMIIRMTAGDKQMEKIETANSRPAVDVTTPSGVKEAWLSKDLSANTGGSGDEHFRAGTVVRIDGPDHLVRRRAMQKLLSRGGHQYFRDTALYPTADELLGRWPKHPAPAGFARAHLVPPPPPCTHHLPPPPLPLLPPPPRLPPPLLP